MKWVTLSMILLCFGCVVCSAGVFSRLSSGHHGKRSEVGPSFKDWYKKLEAEKSPERDVRQDEALIRLSAENMPLRDFLRYVAARSTVSIVAEKNLDSAPVTIEVNNETVGKVLGVVARRLGVQLTRTGSLYYLGTLRPEDRGVLVRRVRRLDKEGLDAVLKVLPSENGRFTSFADGLVVFGDRVEVLERVNELLDRVETQSAPSWVIQLYLVAMHHSDLTELGLDSVPALDVSATFAMQSRGGDAVPGVSGQVSVNGGLRSVLRATRDKSSVHMVAQPLFVLLDGETSHFGVGERVPVPNNTVSDQGTVSTTGYTDVQTGLRIEVGLRELGESSDG